MKYKLEELCGYIARGIAPKYSDDSDFCVLNQKCVRDNNIHFANSRRHNNIEKKVSSDKTLRIYDILVNSTGVGTAGRVAQLKAVPKDYSAITADSHVTIIRPNPEQVHPEFLGYFLQYRQPYIESLAKGSTGQTEISRDSISNIEVDLPDAETQKKIVRILSALDQKIELNNQQSKVLETAAFTLYDDFINTIDESNFKKVAIGQIADCKLGGTPSRAKTEYWGGGINWINSGAINSFRITEPSELITEEGFKHTSTYMLPKGTTVLAITGATLGQVSRMEIEGCANQSVIGIVGNSAISNEYIYLTIVRNIQEIINRQTGGAQQHINKNDIKEFEIILPNQQLMNNFTNIVRPIFEKIAQNEFENKTLSSLRDALLPELMSGEIDLNEVIINE